ncbi:MAG TPA: permease prefix domain 1-containing protein [Gemmatimonadota bacterium]|nr:permease prefix domain 1-containing protein [Gemmatimonadota bacterium]
MNPPDSPNQLEEQIEQWRSYVRRRQAIQPVDVEELEDHLREQVSSLLRANLTEDEAFLIAVKRLGDLDSLSREFAREHSDRLWKQLVVSRDDSDETGTSATREAVVAFGLAVLAAIAIKLPELFGFTLDADEGFYARNVSLFVFPLLAGFFVWKRRAGSATQRWLAAGFVAGAVLANIYPFEPAGSTEILTAMHLPIALWLVVGVAYAGGRWGEPEVRMDFVRFSGELFIYYVLIALGGGVFMGLMALLFQAIGIDIEPFFERWMLPCCALGAVVIASWLVEAKQSVIENMAPVLTKLFTPLFTILLIAYLATMTFTGRMIEFNRELLIAFDLLLAVVLGLLLYSISARDPRAPKNVFDVLSVVLVISALLVDALALWTMASRISEMGFTPNRVAALGENIVLLVNLAWSAVLYVRFLRGQAPFTSLERWQTSYLPVYGIWAAIVVTVFPPLFGYI